MEKDGLSELLMRQFVMRLKVKTGIGVMLWLQGLSYPQDLHRCRCSQPERRRGVSHLAKYHQTVQTIGKQTRRCYCT